MLKNADETAWTLTSFGSSYHCLSHSFTCRSLLLGLLYNQHMISTYSGKSCLQIVTESTNSARMSTNSIYTQLTWTLSPSKKHRIPQNLLPHQGKFCTMCFESVWKSWYFSFPIQIVFCRGNMWTDKIGKIFRMILHCFSRAAFFNISKIVFFFHNIKL